MVDSISVIGPGWRATDENGTVITDGVLYFYEAGTSTPLEVFSDADLTASLGVDVSCDSSGYPVTAGNAKTIVYTGTAPYKIKLVSSADGTKIWEHDNVRPANQVSVYPITVGHSTSTTGTGTITLGDTLPGCRSFVDASIENGEIVSITIKDGDDYEESYGVYNSGSGTVARNLSSSTTGNLLDLSGNAIVFTGTDSKTSMLASLGVKRLIAILADRKAYNQDGGTFTQDLDNVRVLSSTPEYNYKNIVSVASNRFMLPAGTYHISWSAPAHRVGYHRSFLYNYTDSIMVTGGEGTSEYSYSLSPVTSNRSCGDVVITISSHKEFEIRHRCQATHATYGFGVAAPFGDNIYTRVVISKIG